MEQRFSAATGGAGVGNSGTTVGGSFPIPSSPQTPNTSSGNCGGTSVSLSGNIYITLNPKNCQSPKFICLLRVTVNFPFIAFYTPNR